MNLIMKLIGMVTGRAGKGKQGAMLGAAMSVLGGGGLGSLLGKFQSAGLGSKFDSFVGAGANEKLSGRQVRAALGDDDIARIANEAGVSPRQAKNSLAKLLPQAVDKMTPDGQIPEPGSVDVDSLRQQLGL